MGRIVEVPAEGIYNLISQAYHAGGQYQWAREAMVNSIQAKATWVHFGVDKQSYEKAGVARRYVADNGVGMNETDIRIFLSSFGGGGRKISKTENFGQGFKASCYEWNSYGVIVMSWTKDNPDGTMIWIRLDPKTQMWSLKDFEVATLDEDDNEIIDVDDCISAASTVQIGGVDIDLTKFRSPEIDKAGQGTVFLFLGDSPTRDTANGDYNRNENTIRGIVKYLNERFLDIKDGVSVSVESFESKAKGSDRRESKDNFVVSPSGDRKTLHSRRVKGSREFISKDSQSGKIMVRHNTEIEWFLTEAPDTGDGSYGPAKPMIAVQYDDEAYDRKNTVRDFRPFGVTDGLRDRVWMVIKPPKYSESDPTAWGVMPQASRGMLIAKGGEPLPWSDWSDDFYDSMPEPIRSAIKESQAGESDDNASGRRERLRRVKSRLATRFRPPALVQSSSGTIAGTDNGSASGTPRDGAGKPVSPAAKPSKPRPKSDTGGKGDDKILTKDQSGSLMGNMKPRGDGIPAVVWDSAFVDDEIGHAARFDPQEERDGSYGTIHINLSFPMFRSEFEYWAEEYSRHPQSDVVDVVKQIYEDELVAKVLHANKMRAQVLSTDSDGTLSRIGASHVEKWTSPESLTSGLLGLVNVEQRIKAIASSRFGKKSRPAKVAD